MQRVVCRFSVVEDEFVNGDRVTVMVPSYNYAQYLVECVESAASQPEADVVIVDNGSTDNSPAIGAGLAERYANVRFVRHASNEGIITSFNRCRDEVRADYAMMLCADDLLTPGSLARSIEFMDAHPGVGLVYGTAIDFSDSSEVALGQLPTEVGVPVIHEGGSWIDELCRTCRNPIRNPEALMRSSVLADVGPYEPACRYTSDLNLWLRIAGRAQIAYLPGPVQAMFRQHESNAGKAFPHNSVAELEQRWMAFERFLACCADDPRRVGWEELARHRLAHEARYSASREFVTGGDGEVDALLAFGDRLDPTGPKFAERAGWRLRRFLGPSASRWFPGMHVRPVFHRLQRMNADRRRARVGIG
jgi:glycosyltransferase involved in cell wall biosynthesis